MDALRWRRIEGIFHAALDEPGGAARHAKLSELCGGDTELAAEVAALLAADDRLERIEAPGDPHLGLRLGNYQIDSLVARGGMAAVYRARRADDQFQQDVAIKIMDLRLSDPALVAGFKAERQILAALEHPTLTRLLDGGVTSFGEPYLVMEYVDGERIDQYCDRRRLDLGGRIQLFTQVCAGLGFAHRNLVLHRDLKPSNILVTADGHAKVVDFGTATLLQPERLATVSRAPLTPAYASPEQLTGQAVGTASDQYSLGLVLYELATGVPAFADRPSLMGSIERALAGAQPTPAHLAVTGAAAASRRTSPSRLRRQLSGDLGTIIRKTLAPDPAARYSSVQHVADDLERWAAGEAILGRAPSLVYRTSRFVRRHWLPVSLAATLLVSLLAATAVSFQQTAIARTESAKARQLNRFLTQMLSSANPMWVNPNAAAAGSITVRDVLDGAGELIASELGATPEVEAEMRRTLGRTYLGMGESAKALPHLDRALALYRQQGDDAGLARTQWHRGVISINRGDFTGAETLIRQAVSYVRSQDPPVDAEFHVGATADLGMAIGSQRPGDPEAIALMREAITVADRHGLRGGALVLANLSIQLIRRGELGEGEAALREALRRWETLGSTSPEYYSGLRTLAVLLFQRGDYVAAERTAARAVEGFARMMSDHPMMPNFKLWWARTLLALGNLERGWPVARDAYAGYARIRPAGHPDLATPLITLGIAHRLDGRLRESERVIREAQAILRRNPSGKDRAADAAGELGLTLRALGSAAEAGRQLRESHALFQSAYGDAHPLTKQALARVQAGEPVRVAR